MLDEFMKRTTDVFFFLSVRSHSPASLCPFGITLSDVIEII